MREGGAAPATVGIIAGEIVVGLSRGQIEHPAPTLELRADDLFGDSNRTDRVHRSSFRATFPRYETAR